MNIKREENRFVSLKWENECLLKVADYEAALRQARIDQREDHIINFLERQIKNWKRHAKGQ
jgi:hypothetical protein